MDFELEVYVMGDGRTVQTGGYKDRKRDFVKKPAPSGPYPDIKDERRCSMADRLEYEDHLAQQYAEGRLSYEEWMLRHEACTNAVTISELKRLLKDLPELPGLTSILQEREKAAAEKTAVKRRLSKSGKDLLIAGFGTLAFIIISTVSSTEDALNQAGRTGATAMAVIFALAALACLATTVIVTFTVLRGLNELRDK